MGWLLTTVTVALIVIVVAGAALAFFKRYCIGWQWGTRNVWSICEEWRQRLSWLWAPREEKVGLVKAQHPTAQTIPGLYRQAGHNSDSDFRLDAQGAFIRFEPVDNYLHPPLSTSGGSTIPPQPLRPAPQPRPTSARARPSPLQTTSNTLDYLRIQESGPYPLTPPPPHQRSHLSRTMGPSIFHFQSEPPKSYGLLGTTSAEHSPFRMNQPESTNSITENIQMTPYMTQHHLDSRLARQELEGLESRIDRRLQEEYEGRYSNPYRAFEFEDDLGVETSRIRYRVHGVPVRNLEDASGLGLERGSGAGDTEDDGNDSYGSYDIIQRSRLMEPSHIRNDSTVLVENGFAITNPSNSIKPSLGQSIFGVGQEAFNSRAKTLQGAHSLGNELDRTNGKSAAAQQGIEMTSLRSSSLQEDISLSYFFRELQGQPRAPQYNQSLPALPLYDDSINDIGLRQDRQQLLYGDTIQRRSINGMQLRAESACSPIPPPPPAPPDPPAESIDNNAGSIPGIQRIFSAFRTATSQSYIGPSDFFNSILSPSLSLPPPPSQPPPPPPTHSSSTQSQPAMLPLPLPLRPPPPPLPSSPKPTPTSTQHRQQQQQQPTIHRFPYMPSSPTLVNESTSNRLQDEQELYSDSDTDMLGLDGSKRSSDLYSPELNLEAHRTAQVVCNSLQHPPSSPLLMNESNQDAYDFMTDSAFMRKPEEILSSLEEQCRKSTEKLNGMPDYPDMDYNNSEPLKRRNSQEFHAALEELQLKRRLSQSLDEAYLCCYMLNDTSPGSRRGSQVLELETGSNESNLKRAISCESVCSDTSVVPNDLKDVPVVGYICVGIERWNSHGGESQSDLTVTILEARDLITVDGKPAEHTFAKVCLLPDTETHVRTKLYKGSPSPSYQGKFCISGSVAARTLLVEVFSDDSASGGGVSLIGEATLRLPAPKSQATTWLPLTKSGVLIPQLGELMFSLSYLPTAERLKLVVVKASNLRGVKGVNAEFFVKVYLLQNKKKIYKKRTSVKKGEKNPIFNEAIIFNVPAHMLENIDVRLTVAEVNYEQGATGKPFTVGHIIVGPSATGIALLHWKEMLISLRRPVSRWHPLRK